MLIYFIEIYSKTTEEIVDEIEIPNNDLECVAEIMKWDTADKESFLRGIGGFDVTKEQALALESLLGRNFYSDDTVIQISGGEI